ncbi:MAG: hypothetical protein IKZ41_03775, partial [Clostridia bacterium]|nr:hypothetical protein [Clostridia bacterium]
IYLARGIRTDALSAEFSGGKKGPRGVLFAFSCHPTRRGPLHPPEIPCTWRQDAGKDARKSSFEESRMGLTRRAVHDKIKLKTLTDVRNAGQEEPER